jgi:hypothetical protein
MLEELNKARKNKPTWTRGHTGVSDLSSEEKKNLCGCAPLNPFEVIRLNERIKADAKRMKESGNGIS